MTSIKVEVNGRGWLILTVPVVVEERAKEIRRERDRQYGNIFVERPSDERWVGEVGELCFDRWLTSRGVAHVWIQERAAGKADFIIHDTAVGLKTVKRQWPVRPNYTAQITAQHAYEPVDQFFFASYEIPRRRLWMLGGVSRVTFLERARYYQAGEWVHKDYQIREGHEIYNIGVAHLTGPKMWLSEMTERVDDTKR